MNVAVKPSAAGLATPVLEVRDLKTQFFTDEGVVRAVDGVSFSVAAGEALGIVGESGSGKSVTALSLMRLLEEPSRIVGGEIRFQGRDVLRADPEEMRNLRGGRIAMVFQDPMTSLNPVLRIARQLVETMVVHGNYTGDQATDRAVKMLGRMGINAPERAIHSYPHQFSGGMRQRVVLAMGMSNDPVLLIADEPTTALDVTIQAQILELLRELNRDFGTAIVLISHDLGVIAGVCARVVVMYAGEVVEEGPTEEVLSDPRHPYTWALINAVPRIDRHTPGNRRLTTIEGAPPDPLDLPQGCRFAPRCPFRIERCTEHPELLGGGARPRRPLLGDAGRRAARAARGDPSPGRARGAGRPLPASRERSWRAPPRGARPREALPAAEERLLPEAPDRARRRRRRPRRRPRRDRRPRRRVGLREIDARPRADPHPQAGRGLDRVRGRGHRAGDRRGDQAAAPAHADGVPGPLRLAQPAHDGRRHHRRAAALPRPCRDRSRDPRAGRRAALDRRPQPEGGAALPARVLRRPAPAHLDRPGARGPPDFIIADEPISALDVNIQAQIINLMLELQEKFGLTYLFIAHDLAVVRHISDRIVVLYLGKVVEVARSGVLFERPLHPYTRYLISAVPVPDVAVERRRQHLQLKGEPPSAVDPPSGCRFRTRCPIARAVCAEVPPPLAEHEGGHFAACHFAGEFQPDGGAHAARHG